MSCDPLPSGSHMQDPLISAPNLLHAWITSFPGSLHYLPYPKVSSGSFHNSPESSMICICCSLNGHRASICDATQSSRQEGLLLCLGISTTSNLQMASTSACTLMCATLASLIPVNDMVHIPAPSASTCITVLGTAPETDLSKILYILPIPYKPQA